MTTGQCEHILCRHCDLLVEVPAFSLNKKAVCPRCNTVLYVKRQDVEKQILGYALSALMMIALSCIFPFISITVAGIESQIDLLSIPSMVYSEGYSLLSLAFIFFVILAPIFCLISIFILLMPSSIVSINGLKIRLAKGIFWCKTWCMAEIFLTGVLVSFVKLVSYGDIGLGQSFLPFCLFSLLQIKTLQLIDRRWLWQRIAPLPKVDMRLHAGHSGLSQGLRFCECCTAILPEEQHRCPRCLTRGHIRKKDSLQWTMALLVTAFLLYIPANVLPIMVTQVLGSPITSTIMSGIILLWKEGAYPIAMIIFIASIMIPSVKIIAIAWLCWDAKKQKYDMSAEMLFVYRIVELVGRWSMIDVFVIAVLASLVKLGRLMGVYPASGVILFCMVVVITMFSAMSFDPRLSWDRLNHFNKQHKKENSDENK